jgi:hypothetical protein
METKGIAMLIPPSQEQRGSIPPGHAAAAIPRCFAIAVPRNAPGILLEAKQAWQLKR